MYDLFNDAVSISDCMELNVRWLVNNELKRMWKKVVVVLFEVLSDIFLVGQRKTTKVIS
jgi:hypothetical protein